MQSVHLISLGCSKNLVDSEVMLGSLLNAGFVLAADPKVAEIIIVNTCAFIDEAKEEAIDTILEAAKFKREGACKYLIVTGCLAQRYQDELVELLPEVDLFVGTGEFPKIASLIKDIENADKLNIGTPEFLYDHESQRVSLTKPHLAYVKIAEGCSNNCSYCAIPKIRGRYRSRDTESVISEVKNLLNRGVKEINLIAQDTTAFGSDLKSEHKLTHLLNRLNDLPDKKWIRLLYTYPNSITKELLDIVNSKNDIVPYLDIPVQHISDKILTCMRRRGNSEELRRLFTLIRKYYPNIFLRTTVMVGFPGEGKKEFDELIKFVTEFEFDHLGCFVFSPQDGTSAAKMKGHVNKEIAIARRNTIMDLQREISEKRLEALIGKDLEVLFEGESARHAGQAPDVDGIVEIEGKLPKAGEFVKVKITSSSDYDLTGTISGLTS
ncbi:MAG: 30S ribosomal protein S12 methylthiotransferase RimO [Pseudomonadota bacterium]